MDKTEEQRPKISMSLCIYLSHDIFNTGFWVISAEIITRTITQPCFICICFYRFWPFGFELHRLWSDSVSCFYCPFKSTSIWDWCVLTTLGQRKSIKVFGLCLYHRKLKQLKLFLLKQTVGGEHVLSHYSHYWPINLEKNNPRVAFADANTLLNIFQWEKNWKHGSFK